MAFPRPTLRDALARHRPFLACATTKTGNTRSLEWPKPSVQEWTAFNIHTFNESYGHIIDKVLPSHLVEKVPSTDILAGLTMRDDSGPKNIIAWNSESVMPIVKDAKASMGLHPGVLVSHTYSSADGLTKAKIPRAPPKTVVDHDIELLNSRRDILVVGLGRTSAKWKGSVLLNGLEKTTVESLWPLRQLANLCIHSRTRYGYIQTDEELVVCYFTATGLPEVDKFTDWTAHIMSVPWNTDLICGQSAAPKTHLTTELALWWLCMLSLSDNDRSIVKADEVIPIDSWAILPLGDGSGWVRRHRYSGFEEPTNAPGFNDGDLPGFDDSLLNFDFLFPSTATDDEVTYLGRTSPNV